MAWLFIDTIRPDTFRLGLLDAQGKGIASVTGRSNKLLPAIARRVPLAALRRIDGVCVVQGPGSFTSVRTGVLVANLLSRVLRKPLVGIESAQATDLLVLSAMLREGSLPSSSTVLPVYDAEPNITLPKHAC